MTHKASTPRPQVGFIGIGSMGGAIAERLVGAGVELHFHDRNPQAGQTLAQAGATAHMSPRSVADAVPIVCACLPSSEASRMAALGPTGIVHGTAVRTYIEMSTIGSALIVELAGQLSSHGIQMLDAPVSGGPVGARAGTLAIMLSGAPELRASIRPVLALVSSRIFDIGDVPGLAQKMKLVNNLLAAANMANAFEALVLGTKMGLSPSKIVDVVRQSSGNNTGMDPKFTGSIIDRSFRGTAHISVLVKDIALAEAESATAGLPLDHFAALSGMAKLWRAAAGAGLLEEQVPALIKLVEQDAGVEVSGRKSS